MSEKEKGLKTIPLAAKPQTGKNENLDPQVTLPHDIGIFCKCQKVICLAASAAKAVESASSGICVARSVEKKLWLLSGSGGSDFIITKFADDASVRRNLIETPGDNPGVNELVKSAAGPILIKPVIFPPPLRSPVNGESKKKHMRISAIYNNSEETIQVFIT